MYPDWVSKDWDGGQANHNEAGELIIYKGNLYSANWHTSSVPGSNSSWTLMGVCD
ncbi:cellulose-binding domain-containing protein [Brenneria uluponensis]|uniref:cellulose-binding domain-containing protein n=1 Tax=Brenneria uluponensis TaxID=3057057 RepID=UPI0028EAD675|nr:cellulose-binding domain-containing protein [Brenneria ulupoensis]